MCRLQLFKTWRVTIGTWLLESDERCINELYYNLKIFLENLANYVWSITRADCDAPCFEQLKATHLRASPKQQVLLDVLLQLIKTWPLTIGPWFEWQKRIKYLLAFLGGSSGRIISKSLYLFSRNAAQNVYNDVFSISKSIPEIKSNFNFNLHGVTKKQIYLTPYAHMQWTNIWRPAVRVKQNIFGQKIDNIVAYSITLHLHTSQKEGSFLREQKTVDLRHFRDF